MATPMMTATEVDLDAALDDLERELSQVDDAGWTPRIFMSVTQ